MLTFINRNIILCLFLSILLPITIALLLEHWGGYHPCSLCLKQRWAYYFGLCFIVFVWFNPLLYILKKHDIFFLTLLGLVFFANALLALYHSGVEWALWEGPNACNATQYTPQKSMSVTDLLSNSPVISCKDPALRIAGLSLTNLNVLMSCFIVYLSFQTYVILKKKRHSLSDI